MGRLAKSKWAMGKQKTCADALEIVKAIVSRIDYKPDFKIDVYGTYDVSIRVIFKRPVPDSNNPSQVAPQIFSRDYTPELVLSMKDPYEYILRDLIHSIQQMEMHEMDEWLRVDGVRVREPHPELDTQKAICETRACAPRVEDPNRRYPVAQVTAMGLGGLGK